MLFLIVFIIFPGLRHEIENIIPDNDLSQSDSFFDSHSLRNVIFILHQMFICSFTCMLNKLLPLKPFKSIKNTNAQEV